MKHNTYIWTIVEKRDEVPGVQTLILEPNDTRPDFISGQYLTVQLKGFEPAEGKSYSISSTPREKNIGLTIKTMGNFSRALLAHNVGDALTTSAPYGFFYPELDEPRDLVFIVGGIGITPCMSMISSLLTQGFSNSISLFYSNKTHRGIVFNTELEALSKEYKNFSIHHFITQELPIREGVHTGRMTGEIITSLLKQKTTDTDFFICGSIDFTKSLWTSLRAQGIPSPQLYTEGFF